MPRKTIIGVVILLALLAMPFTSNTGNAAKSNLAALPGPAQTNEIDTSDDRLTAVARQVPGFGGMFFDQDGIMQVYMEGDRGPANAALMTLLDDVITREVGRGERLSQKGVEIREGKYDFLDLHRWHQQMSPVALALPGVVLTDIDDRTNRLRIGITDSPGLTEDVEESLSKLGVPREAVLISEAKPVFHELQPQGFHRPLRGGLRISFGSSVCTLGFIAVRQGITGFVTNSHCTNVQGVVDGTVYHQPSASGTTNRVGLEIADPAFFSGSGCPAGRRCRRSDSAFARVPHPSGPPVATALGTIVRGIPWNGVDIFQITAEAAPLVGQAVTKVGIMTSRTAGTVQQTCVNINIAATNITQLCQSIANYTSAGGDSGSPVFRITTLPSVVLAGIHWGGNATTSIFSPITNIQQELGALNTCAGSC